MLIECAAKGDMVGQLSEWPYLREALVRHGHVLPMDTPAERVIELCRQIVNEEINA
jgi:hypothetical protein